MTPAEKAEKAGFDLSLIDESLRLKPEQRLQQHQVALELVIAMERAGARLRRSGFPFWLSRARRCETFTCKPTWAHWMFWGTSPE